MDDVTAVCWDLDSTLASTLHRHEMIGGIREGRLTWDEYSLACSGDEPVEASLALMRLLWPYHHQIAISGRGEVARQLTGEWVAAHGIPLDRIILRPPGDHRPGGEFKAEQIRKLQADGISVVMFFDDWAADAETIRAKTAVPVLVVNPCYPANPMSQRPEASSSHSQEGNHGYPKDRHLRKG